MIHARRRSVEESPLNQPLLPLMDDEVGDDGRPLHPRLPAGCAVEGSQAFELGTALPGRQERLQLFFPLSQRFLLSHCSPLTGCSSPGLKAAFYLRGFVAPIALHTTTAACPMLRKLTPASTWEE